MGEKLGRERREEGGDEGGRGGCIHEDMGYDVMMGGLALGGFSLLGELCA